MIRSLAIASACLACSAEPTASPVADVAPECVASPLPETSCEYRTTIVVAVGQTRLITPSFFDDGNRETVAPDALQWQFGPASIATVTPVPGMTTANIRGDAVGSGELRLVNLDTGAVLATADVCVFTPGPGTDTVRAELCVGN